MMNIPNACGCHPNKTHNERLLELYRQRKCKLQCLYEKCSYSHYNNFQRSFI